MSIVLFSKTFIDKITLSLGNSGGQQFKMTILPLPLTIAPTRTFANLKIRELGLGIRDLYTVNRSLILRVAWNIATAKDPHLIAILEVKYFPTNSFRTTTNNSPKSIFWASILQLLDTPKQKQHYPNP